MINNPNGKNLNFKYEPVLVISKGIKELDINT